ncbi:recombinase family protein [Pseudarthrobacter sp. NPDC092184]|uniref:recombinase family protein n=1 Tax=unclassified Pseudarthrobacter TaxID=2647000 RepID=UPI0038202031
MTEDNVAIVYARVSTEEQAKQGASLASQVAVLAAEAARRNWDIHVIREQASGKSLNRKGIAEALRLLQAGKARYLMAIRIDRLSRNVADFAGLMETARKQGWALVMPEMDIDTTTSQGEFMANVQVSVAQYERRLIGDRTRAGMAQRRLEGKHLGRKRELTEELVHRIATMKSSGMSLRAIASELEAEGIPTAHGGSAWHASTIRSVLNSRTALGTYTAGQPATSP